MPEYAVTEPVGSRQLARGARRGGPFLAIAVGLGLATTVLPSDLPVSVVIAGLVLLGGLRLAVEMRPAAVVRVGPAGMELDEQRVPWRSIGRITITRHPPPSSTRPEGEVEVAATLRAEPGTGAPAGPPLRATARADRMNVGQFVGAIRAHVLPDTEIAEGATHATGAREGAGAGDTHPAGPYVLTQTSSLRGVLRRLLQTARQSSVGFVAFAVLTVTLALGLVEREWNSLLRIAAVLVAVALLVVLAWGAWPKSVLRVGPSGVEFSVRSVPGLARELGAERIPWPRPHADTVTIPWSSIWQVVVIYPDPGSPGGEPDRPIQIGLRPRRDAPLPGHVAVRVVEPSDPSAIPPRLRVSVRHAPVDVQALVTAVRAFAVESASVVAVRGDAERTLG